MDAGSRDTDDIALTRPEDGRLDSKDTARGRSDDEPPSAPEPLPDGLGRYMVIEELGRGGMGVVLRAYDPRLQREVALKKLMAHRVDEMAQARIVREARAMAQLSHPNVVAVYDVEIEGDDVVIAMELVEGQPLSRWLKTTRSWEQVVSVFVGAGRGLAAAHDSGLLHRDFKPANVIVRDDGRAQVTDFGLARSPNAPATESSGNTRTGPHQPVSHASIDTPVTVVGTVVGTPPFMAPECHLDEALDSSVDQYAFCVSLWRALTGTMPFTGSIEELWLAKAKGPPPWPSAVKVPPPIVAAIRRGLSPEAKDRWPSMGPLLATLSIRPARRDRLWALAVIGTMAMGAAAVATAAFTGTTTAPCSGSEAAIADVWGPNTRQAVETALKDIDRTYASRVAQWALLRLDERAEAWVQGHRDACEATTIRGEQSEAVMDLRMACLDRARQQMDAAVQVLTRADADVLDRVEPLVGGLVDLGQCANVAGLQQSVPPPSEPAIAAAVEEVRKGLAEVTALRLAARLEDAHTRLKAIETQASEIDYPPLRTELLLARAAVDEDAGRYDAAADALRQALREGLHQGQWPEAWRASNGLVFVSATHQARLDVALAHVDTAWGLLERIGLGGTEEASTRMNHGQALLFRGRYEQAEAEQRAALALYQSIRDADHPDLARARTNIAGVLKAQGRYDEAARELEEAARIWEAALSPDYPEVSKTRTNLGVVLKAQGRVEEAEALFSEVIETWERTLGPDHPMLFSPLQSRSNARRALGRLPEAEADIRRGIALARAAYGDDNIKTAMAISTLGLLLKARGDNDGAEQQMRRALAIGDAQLGEDHPRTLRMRSNLANVLKNLARLEEAEVELRSVLALERAVLGPEHPDVATTIHNLANVLMLAERPSESSPLFQQAAQLRKTHLGPDHPRVAISLAGWGQGLLDQDRPAEAIEPLVDAWGILDRGTASPLQRARVGFAYAQALWNSDGDRARARELAQIAKEGFSTSHGPEHESTRDAEAWLETHP